MAERSASLHEIKQYYYITFLDDRPATGAFMIQKLTKELGHIPVTAVVQECAESPDVILNHLTALADLEFINSEDYKKGKIRLTESGKLTNIPN